MTCVILITCKNRDKNRRIKKKHACKICNSDKCREVDDSSAAGLNLGLWCGNIHAWLNYLSKILTSGYIVSSSVCVKDRFGRMFSIGWPSLAPNNNIAPLSLFARLASGNLGNDHVDQLFELQMCVNVLRLYHFLSCGSPARN